MTYSSKDGSNPFIAERIKPGTIRYIFPSDAVAEIAGANPIHSLDDLLKQLDALRWHAAIVGPHGSGKSTLLTELADAVGETGRKVTHVRLTSGQRALPADAWPQPAGSLLIIDGYEQLRFWTRAWLKRITSKHGVGLLVSCHAETNLPTVYETYSSPQLAEQVVATLDSEDLVDPEVVRDYFAESGGDIREMLFQLYDYVEANQNS